MESALYAARGLPQELVGECEDLLHHRVLRVAHPTGPGRGREGVALLRCGSICPPRATAPHGWSASHSRTLSTDRTESVAHNTSSNPRHPTHITENITPSLWLGKFFSDKFRNRQLTIFFATLYHSISFSTVCCASPLSQTTPHTCVFVQSLGFFCSSNTPNFSSRVFMHENSQILLILQHLHS